MRSFSNPNPSPNPIPNPNPNPIPNPNPTQVNQLVLDTAPRDTTQAEGTSDLRLLTDSGVLPLGALSGMLAKKRINAQRDWGFSSCQCLFPPLMMLFAILLLNDIRLDLTIGPPIALIPEEAMPLKVRVRVRARVRARVRFS